LVKKEDKVKITFVTLNSLTHMAGDWFQVVSALVRGVVGDLQKGLEVLYIVKEFGKNGMKHVLSNVIGKKSIVVYKTRGAYVLGLIIEGLGFGFSGTFQIAGDWDSCEFRVLDCQWYLYRRKQ
jgi:hypothetical protein